MGILCIIWLFIEVYKVLGNGLLYWLGKFLKVGIVLLFLINFLVILLSFLVVILGFINLVILVRVLFISRLFWWSSFILLFVLRNIILD